MQPDSPADPGFRRPRHSPQPHSHGGSWKVAYADFVTALMCLFIVLWLTNSSQAVRSSVSGYFQDPRGFHSKTGVGPGLQVDPETVAEFRKMLEESISRLPEFDKLKDNIKFAVTNEGLRIDMMENAQGTFFVAGSAVPSQAGQDLLRLMGTELGRTKNRLAIEGHSDSQPYRNTAPGSGYSNWELSADRANAARRILSITGVGPAQVAEVRGFADQMPWNVADPQDPRNRRISVVVKF